MMLMSLLNMNYFLCMIIVIVSTQCICFGLVAAESKHCACLACAFFSWVALTCQKIVMALNFETSWIAGLRADCDVQIPTGHFRILPVRLC